MKNIVIFLLLNLISVHASDFTWGSYGLVLHGEKSSILKLSKDIQSFYKSDILERMINRLESESKHINVPKSIYEDGANIHTSYKFLLESLQDANGLIELSANELNEELQAQKEEEVFFKEFRSIKIRGRKDKLETMLSRMDMIYDYEVGRKLFEDIKKCGHSLLIYDDKSALSGGGYTGAHPSTFDIFVPGKGADARIRMRFDQPDLGAHEVGAEGGVRIPFKAIDNIFHELVHAKHVMCGTTSRNNAEAQAIEEENLFRKIRPDTADWPARDPKEYENGVQTWFGLY